MHKKATRLLTLVLAVMMLCSLLTVFGAAANVKHYDTYTILGDSIAAGYGLPSYPVPEPAILDGTRVAGSYADLVGKAVGCNNYYNMAHCGNRAVDINWLVNPEAAGDDLTIYYLASALSLDVTTEEGLANAAAVLAQERAKTQEAVKKADLITINCGSNDSLTYAFTVYGIAHMNDDPAEAASEAERMERIGKIPLIGTTLQGLSTMAQTLKFVAELKTYMDMGQAEFKENWDALIAAIRKVNPDCTIVAVAMYNPFQTVTLTKNTTLPVGQLAWLSIQNLNNYMASESAMKDEYIMAYCPNPEVHEFPPILDDSMSIGPFIESLRHGTHPTANGHAYMAEQIIKVLPTEDAQPDPAPSGLPFKDVQSGQWFYDAVKYCYDNGLMDGMTEDTFVPLGSTTRAQFATVLWRLAEKPAPKSANPFSDCQSHWAKDAISWAYENKIVDGMTETTFAPNDNVTREQMVAMLYRYCSSPAVTGDLSAYKDAASVSGYAVDAFIWATQNGIVTGRTADTLVPKGQATRAELATILQRFDQMQKADAAA